MTIKKPIPPRLSKLKNFTSEGENCKYVTAWEKLAVNHSFTFRKMTKVRINKSSDNTTLAFLSRLKFMPKFTSLFG